MKSELYFEQYSLQNQHWWFVAKKEIILSQLALALDGREGGINILDAGCGTGLMLPALSAFGNVFGMDFSKEAISFAKKNFSGTIKHGALPDNIPYEPATFEVLVALDVIEHVEDDLSSLINLKKIMKPGAVGIITVPACMFLWSHHDVINEHKRRYSKAEFSQKLHAAGFVVEKISYYNFFLFPLVLLIRLINKLKGTQEGSDVKLPSKLVNVLLKNVFSLEQYFLKVINFPIGVSLIARVRVPDSL